MWSLRASESRSATFLIIYLLIMMAPRFPVSPDKRQIGGNLFQPIAIDWSFETMRPEQNGRHAIYRQNIQMHFLLMKFVIFWFKFHWSLSLLIQLTMGWYWVLFIFVKFIVKSTVSYDTINEITTFFKNFHVIILGFALHWAAVSRYACVVLAHWLCLVDRFRLIINGYRLEV